MKRTPEEYKSMEQKKAELGIPPAIDFWRPSTKQEENPDEYKKSKDAYATVSIPIIITAYQRNSTTYERHVKIFKEGTPEEFCAHLHVVNELYKKLGYGQYWTRTKKEKKTNEEGDEVEVEVSHNYDINGNKLVESKSQHTWRLKTALLSSTLGGRALQQFEQLCDKYSGMTRPDPDADEDEENPPVVMYTQEEIYLSAVNDLSHVYFSHPKEAAKTQKRYLREGGLTFCGEYRTPLTFWTRLQYVNQLINYFPWVKKANGTEERPTPLDEDELIEILDKARSTDIRKLMLTVGDTARKYSSPDEYSHKLEQWHENVQLTKTLDAREKHLACRSKTSCKGQDLRSSQKAENVERQ
jgi:hypothetical protein